ncbi:dihydrofolate reductase family protein [Actinokineospora sp. NPDC004072]
MRKIVATTIVSLDGVIDPVEWSMPWFDDDAGVIAKDRLWATDALLLGRKTYVGFAEAWPEMQGDEYADRMNSLPKYVVSSTLEETTWGPATIIKGDDLVAEVTKLKEQDGQEIMICGVGQLAHALLEHKLLDLLEVWIHPHFVGATKPEGLLGREGSEHTFTFVESKTTKSGVIVAYYEPVKGE